MKANSNDLKTKHRKYHVIGGSMIAKSIKQTKQNKMAKYTERWQTMLKFQDWTKFN